MHRQLVEFKPSELTRVRDWLDRCWLDLALDQIRSELVWLRPA